MTFHIDIFIEIINLAQAWAIFTSMLILNCKHPRANHYRIHQRTSKYKLSGKERALLLLLWMRNIIRRTIFMDWMHIWKENKWRSTACFRTWQALRYAMRRNLTLNIEYQMSQVVQIHNYICQMTIFPTARRTKRNRNYLVGIKKLVSLTWKRFY